MFLDQVIDQPQNRELATTTEISVTVLAISTPCGVCREELTSRLVALSGVAMIHSEGHCVHVIGSVPSERLAAVVGSAARSVQARVLLCRPLWDVATLAKCSHLVQRHAFMLLMIGEAIARRVHPAQAAFMDVWIHHIMRYVISLSPLYAGAGNIHTTSSAAQQDGGVCSRL